MKKVLLIVVLVLVAASYAVTPVLAGGEIPQYLCGMDGVVCGALVDPDCVGEYCLVNGSYHYSDDPATAAVQKEAVVAKITEMTKKLMTPVPTPTPTPLSTLAPKGVCFLSTYDFWMSRGR